VLLVLLLVGLLPAASAAAVVLSWRLMLSSPGQHSSI
jgi:hypothetical protein